MKKFKGLLLIAGIVMGVSAQAGRFRSTGTAKAATNAGQKVSIGVTQLTDQIRAHMGKSTNTLKIYFDSRKKDYKAVATGNVALNLYKAIVKTGTGTGN